MNPENVAEGTQGRGYVLRIDASNFVPDYEHLISLFSELDSDQYYFPKSDIHLTVFEFVSFRADYRKHDGNLETFKKVSQNILRNSEPFKIELIGTVFTRDSGLIAGIDNGMLIRIRESLRNELQKIGLEPLERYRSVSSHISFMSFRNKPKSREGLISLIENTREMHLGFIEVSAIELVEHDWYSRVQNRKVISNFLLGRFS